MRIDKDYVFDTPEGRRTLADLFEGRRQLLVQHFMLGPGWEQGCPSCSYMADHTDGMTSHLAQRDVTFVAVSRAPLAEIERFRQRMGWQFNWVSSQRQRLQLRLRRQLHAGGSAPRARSTTTTASGRSRAEELPGISVFCKDDAGEVFHTYSTYGRGVEVMMGTYHMLDLTPKGRDERDVPYKMEWVRHHDRYEPQPRRRPARSCCDRTPDAPRARMSDAMASLWPWLAVAGLGALHGLSPANGWMFAAACGVRARDAAQARRALLPIAFGHVASIALVALVVAQGLAMDRGCSRAWPARCSSARRRAAAARRRRLRSRSARRPATPASRSWSFLMATAHGAGLMLVPALVPLCLADNPAREITASGSLPGNRGRRRAHGGDAGHHRRLATGVCRGLALRPLMCSEPVQRRVCSAALAATGLLLLLTR